MARPNVATDEADRVPDRLDQRDFTPPPGSVVVTLVRHGQTIAAERDRLFDLLDGQGDPPLSDRGRRQAVATAARLVAAQPTAIFVSSLRRTSQTAAPLAAALGVEPTVEPDLREVFLGEWEGGRYRFEAAARNPLVGAVYETGTHDSIPGAELDRDFRVRVERAFRRIAAEHSDGHVVIVSHGGAINALLSVLTGAPSTTFGAISNCGISQVVDLGPRVVLRSFNDTSHLTGI